MLKKLPLTNPLLQCLSATDPKALGHSVTYKALRRLAKFFPTVSIETDSYTQEVSQIQLDKSLPPVEEKDFKLDHWWAKVKLVIC